MSPIEHALGKKGGLVHVRLESTEFSTAGLQIARLEGEEKLQGLFSFDLDLTAVASDGIAPVDLAEVASEMLGSRATLVFERHGHELRVIHGIISEIDEAVDSRVEKGGEAGAFRARLVPRAFGLGLVEVHEVFLDKSIPEIVEEKLGRLDLSVGDDVEFRLAGHYPPREFVVQYKETDLAFVTRLCEYYGITYFFEHAKGADKIVFVDVQSGFEAVAAHALRSGEGDEVIQSLRSNARVVPAMRVVSDYNPVLPRLDLQQQTSVPGGQAGGVVELVTKYKSQEQGSPLSGIRAEETESHRVLLRGKSGAPSFRAGIVVPLSDAPTLADQSILLTAVRHHLTQQAGLLGSDEATAYSNTFEATRGKTQFRPSLVTPCPRVHGVVTAFIEEYLAEGRYAVMDDRGRYWVRFEFDCGEHATKHSLPIRMLQPHAGPSYGMHLPLKRGTEVMVTFLDGDLDRPVIVGSIPNELTQSPVNRSNYQINKLMKTETGIVIEARDVWEPDAPHYQQKPGS
jgi:type VI secretion system secreted protein VgrG